MLRASTAAVMVGMATPRSSAVWLVHFPVPLAPALSRINSTSGFLTLTGNIDGNGIIPTALLLGGAAQMQIRGVIGKDLSNPIPEWAEHGADRKRVPFTVATDMDSPNPDSGEEMSHTNTQLYNILSEDNRFKLGAEVTAPWNAPEPGQTPTMARTSSRLCSCGKISSARPENGPSNDCCTATNWGA